VYYD
jgi:hypothetical protein